MNTMSQQPSQPLAPAGCFHCGLDIPTGSQFFTVIEGQPRQMCCPGCQAVAQTISESGLDNFYKHRATSSQAPEIKAQPITDAQLQELSLYDQPAVQQEFVSATSSDGTREVSLVIEGITCAACVWLLEHHLSNQPGIEKASVNLTNHRARLIWRPEQQPLSAVLGEIFRVGYQAHPYHPNTEEQLLELERKRATRRLGVAGLGMMQVMMMAVALYGGDIQGIEGRYVSFIRWASLLIATPVILYAARPFFTAALRDIKTRHLSMDVPVSIAIGGAYIASVWATITDSGEVYFDSVTMFTFFLLVGRFLEMQARHRTGRAGNAMLNLLPASAIRIVDGAEQLIPASQLAIGDQVLVKPGHTIPADGRIIKGSSSVDESALTGEYLPIHKDEGDTLIGGTINVENPLVFQVTQIGADTQLSAIVRLLERAHEDKPQVARVADRVASYFVAAVLLTAVTVATGWWFIKPEDAFWITLSVLVVTCPCALSLATPTALTAATGTLRQNGMLITRGHVLESFATATHIVFDKTGTLTQGNLSLQETTLLNGESVQAALEIASALERHSEHPIARAFHSVYTDMNADQLKATLGQGIEGTITGTRFRIGKPEYAFEICPAALSAPAYPERSGQWLLLCSEHAPVAWFRLNDQLRPEAQRSIRALQTLGLRCEMLTGDSSSAVQEVAETLGITDVVSGVSPAEKLAHIRSLQEQGAQVIMVGDGINDIPVLAGAQTSVAMGSATDLAKTNADAVLIATDLSRLIDAILLARKTRSIIRQNLGWSLTYNLLALPLAALGFIAPYMAALGMSASSLVVVGNALRLSKLSKQNRVK